MITQIEQPIDAMTMQDLADHLPAELPGLEWTLFSSGLDKKPRGRSTYSLSSVNDQVKLLFDDTTVFVVDARTRYDLPTWHDDRYRVDIYAATMTPAVRAWIATRLPQWWDWHYAARVLSSACSPRPTRTALIACTIAHSCSFIPSPIRSNRPPAPPKPAPFKALHPQPVS